jgi:hypothetical protein
MSGVSFVFRLVELLQQFRQMDRNPLRKDIVVHRAQALPNMPLDTCVESGLSL